LAPLRVSSVFSPPCLEALEEKGYEAALSVNRDTVGKGISVQAWHIAPKIREAMAWRGRPGLLESHPEVCIQRLTGQAARHSKKKIEGRRERFRLLREFDPSVESSLEEARREIGRSVAAVDDFLDAAILAAVADREIETLPGDPGEGEPVIWVPKGPLG